MQRKGDWMQTATGSKFWPLDPKPDEILIEDVARALSKICRFGGHCREFYSVAQHSCHVADIVNGDQAARRWGLLHEAAEAYIGDMVRPLKLFMAEFNRVEAEILSAVSQRFDLTPSMPGAVALADEQMLHAEALELMGPAAQEWARVEKAAALHIRPWSPERAFHEFMGRFMTFFPEERA